jgi:MbtH protein
MYEQDDATTYAVVVNDEEQYSIWRSDAAAPSGWREVGVNGSKQECLDYIASVWTDIRPLSLRRRMDDTATARS